MRMHSDSTGLIVLGCFFSGLLMGSAEMSGDESLSNAFLINVRGCSGSLISPHWVITAAHCLEDFKHFSPPADAQDFELSLDEHEYEVSKSVFLRNSEKKDEFRSVKRIVIHRGFEGQALSWKGFDLALLELSQPFEMDGDGSTQPVCLPSADLEEQGSSLFIAGYGRRLLPFCITDTAGPEALATCGRPKHCPFRPNQCGLNFVYENNTYDHCITDQPNPSARDSDCSNLALHLNVSEGQRVKAHILTRSKDGLEHSTTCYFPLKPVKQGWCTVRDSKDSEDTEPQANRGWGYCSTDEDQKACNEYISDFEVDTQARRVILLPEQLCLDKMAENLAVEQPHVRPEDYRPFLFERFKVFCIGKNASIQTHNDLYFLKSGHNFSQLTPSEGKSHVHSPTMATEGSGSCFGDSGGPLFRVIDTQSKRRVPVLTGVFSYILWGTCRGRDELAYYVRVREMREWINKYVDLNLTCQVHTDGRIQGSQYKHPQQSEQPTSNAELPQQSTKS